MTFYYLDWDVVHAGQPASTWIFLAILGFAVLLFIARSVISRRIRTRTGVLPRRFRQLMLGLGVAVIAGAVLTAAGLEKASHYRQHQQAAFMKRELGIQVHDALQLNGFHSGYVTFDIDGPVRIRGCTLTTSFIDRHGDLKSTKPARGDGTGRLAMYVSCPQPIPTDSARAVLAR